MDFKEFPPDRKGYDNLLVMVCRLSKRVISIPCKKTVTAPRRCPNLLRAPLEDLRGASNGDLGPRTSVYLTLFR